MIKDTFSVYKKKFRDISALLALYCLIISLCFILIYVAPVSLILLIPFIIVPFTFSLQLNISRIINNLPYSARDFFSCYLNYFSRKYYGIYASIKGLLKYLITYFIFYSLVETILLYTVGYKDPALVSLIESINTYSSIQEYYNFLYNQLLQNNTFLFINCIAYAVGTFFALVVLFNHLSIYSFAATMMPYTGFDSMNAKMFVRSFFRNFKKTFYKETFKATWFILLSFALCYVGGFVLAFYLMPNPGFFFIVTVALFFSFIINFIFIPYLFIFSDLLYKRLAPSLMKLAIDSTLNEYDAIMKDKNIPQEVKDNVEAMRKQFEKKDEQEKPNDEQK